MKKLLASVAIIAASGFALNANASTNSTTATETKTTEATIVLDSKDTKACWYCGYWYYYKNGYLYYGGRKVCCR